MPRWCVMNRVEQEVFFYCIHIYKKMPHCGGRHFMGGEIDRSSALSQAGLLFLRARVYHEWDFVGNLQEWLLCVLGVGGYFPRIDSACNADNFVGVCFVQCFVDRLKFVGTMFMNCRLNDGVDVDPRVATSDPFIESLFDNHAVTNELFKMPPDGSYGELAGASDFSKGLPCFVMGSSYFFCRNRGFFWCFCSTRYVFATLFIFATNTLDKEFC